MFKQKKKVVGRWSALESQNSPLPSPSKLHERGGRRKAALDQLPTNAPLETDMNAFVVASTRT